MSTDTPAPTSNDAAVAAALGVAADAAARTIAPPPPPADDTTDTPDDDDDTTGAEELGDAGKQALDRMKARLKAERTRRLAAEATARDLAASDDTARVRAEAERAAIDKANARILRAEVRAAAAGRFADPEDALAFLDLSQFEVDEDGAVDGDDIRTALDDLLTRKPHLAAQRGIRAPLPDRSQGATGRDAPLTTAQQFAQALRDHL